MATMSMPKNENFEISYGIYTIERLPKGSNRKPKWDLHSSAPDQNTAKDHAKILAEQPYYDHVEVQEFKICKETNQRTVQKVKTYSRKGSYTTVIAITAITIAALIAFL